jgi:hypothetical protein
MQKRQLSPIPSSRLLLPPQIGAFIIECRGPWSAPVWLGDQARPKDVAKRGCSELLNCLCALWVSFLLGALLDAVTCFVRPADRAGSPFRPPNQSAQRRIDRLRIRAILSDVGREKYEVRPCSIACGIFSADAALQFRQVVLSAQLVTPPFSFLSFFLHTAFVRAASSYGLRALTIPTFSLRSTRATIKTRPLLDMPTV